MPYKDNEKMKEYQHQWYLKNKEEKLRKSKEYRKKIRKNVFLMLGGKCVYCGCDNMDALEVNHKNGGGYQEQKRLRKKGSTSTFYLHILKGRRRTDDLELTCSICNQWHRLVKLKGIPDKWIITYKN